MAQTLVIPRTLGGTLILQTTPPSPIPLAPITTQVTFRDGNTKVTFRDGVVKVKSR